MCYSAPCEAFDRGYIAVGCKDGTVKAFKVDGEDREPIFTVKYHTDNGRYLTKAGNHGYHGNLTNSVITQCINEISNSRKCKQYKLICFVQM